MKKELISKIFLFVTKRALAVLLISLAVLYLVLALALKHSAASQPPPDLSAREAGLDVYKSAALLVEQLNSLAIIDTRPAQEFELYHLPRAQNLPAASAQDLVSSANLSSKTHVLIVAAKDDEAAKLAGEAAKLAAQIKWHFLLEGMRTWYLTFELPIPLFSDQPAPYGYNQALTKIKSWLHDPRDNSVATLREAISFLAKANYLPSLLSGKKKPASGGKKKSISGGCG